MFSQTSTKVTDLEGVRDRQAGVKEGVSGHAGRLAAADQAIGELITSLKVLKTDTEESESLQRNIAGDATAARDDIAEFGNKGHLFESARDQLTASSGTMEANAGMLGNVATTLDEAVKLLSGVKESLGGAGAMVGKVGEMSDQAASGVSGSIESLNNWISVAAT